MPPFYPRSNAHPSPGTRGDDNTLPSLQKSRVGLPFLLLPFLPRCKRLTIRRRLLGVSKQWRDLLSRMPALWRNLDLSAARRPVRITAVRAYVKRARNSVTHATLFRADSVKGDALKCIFGNCRKLEYLRLVDGVSNGFLIKAAPFATHLTTLIIDWHREISVDCVTELLDKCVELRRAEFHCIMRTMTQWEWKNTYPNLQQLLMHTDSRKPHSSDGVGMVRQILVRTFLSELNRENRSHFLRRSQI